MSLRCIFFTALAATLVSCTYQHDVHEPERAVFEAPAPCKPGAPVVVLGSAADARPTQVIGKYLEVYAAGYLGPVGPYYKVTVGAELAEHANDFLANCLTAKSYCVKRSPISQPTSEVQRLVSVILSSAVISNDQSLKAHFWEGQYCAAEIKVEVRDSSSQRVFFVCNYSTSKEANQYWSKRGEKPFFSFVDLDAQYLEQVNEAIDDAVKKACNDPAFIAAITLPPSATSDAHRRREQ